MSKIEYIDEKNFYTITNHIGGDHWKYLEHRWDYHKKALDILKSLNLNNHNEILEMGTMGIQLAKNSHTIDYFENWNYEGKQPTYNHNAKIIPWGGEEQKIKNKQYKCFIALRVFQHLQPFQKEAFLEAKRIANSVILVVPEISNDLISSTKPKGITPDEFITWNDGVKPNIIEETKMGTLYFWEFN